MSLPGKILYHSWHRPIGLFKDLIAAGGPWEKHLTERGRKEMESAAYSLPPQHSLSGTPLELHLLTGCRFWYQTVFCLWSFGRQSGRALAPIIYDDGTLSSEHRVPFSRLWPATRFVSQSETIGRLDDFLPEARFPVLRERWRNYPNIRKLTDPHLGSKGWKLVLDSDLLFFRNPEFLLNWLDAPDRALHAIDCKTAYGYSRDLLDRLAGRPLAELVNVGLTGLESGKIDWDRLEHWTRILHDQEGTSYYLEQALIAMCVAGQNCAAAPAGDYVTLPVPPEAIKCQAVMHHYVANSKRWYFQNCWKTTLG